jgi:hypothetical protein
MYNYLITIHSVFRWLVLISLVTSIVIAVHGTVYKGKFGKLSNVIRHWTATIAHLQLMLGMGLYMISPLLKSGASSGVSRINDHFFFKYIHIGIMILAIVLITIGSAKAKRTVAPDRKYRVMLIWFVAALLLILIAIPWPFSPLATRPYLRAF